jgi:hypothetical integral membrane protein (TIGR02206 family)
VLALVGAGTVALARWGSRKLAPVLAVLLVASEAAWWLYAAVHRLPLSIALPLHLCDLAPLVIATALINRSRRWAEVGYFWGLAGSGMALLTPDLPDRPGSFLFAQYVLEHGLAVMAAVYLPAALGLRPEPGAVPRVALATAALALIAGAADVLTGGDYLFLRRPPASPTLISLLSPWPWYIPELAALVLAAIMLLNLPFRATTCCKPPGPWSCAPWAGRPRRRPPTGRRWS